MAADVRRLYLCPVGTGVRECGTGGLGQVLCLLARQPVADARGTDIPLLFLQGGRDIQVVAADWALWQDAFAEDPRATLKHYPALNHLGIAGEGPGSLAEYQQPGHVDARLIADVAAWIHDH